MGVEPAGDRALQEFLGIVDDGAADPKGGAVDSGVRFFASPTCHHAPEIYPSVGESEAAALLTNFFKARR